MRFKSIRELADGDTGAVVNDLKPIWLMSPLSVSDTLPLEPDLFDVVVFDEASQIPTEEAIPALCRAAQVIVVGDEMQLPPTSFFSTAIEEDDMQIIAEEERKKIAIVLDADSLLSQAARNLPATMLAWHYRSRSEVLISFSNAAFYDGRLVTIPDQRVAKAQSAEISVRSEDGGAANAGVERMLERPITFHHVTDGMYENRANAPEAR
jgi:superfamily I DNA and/or RNA helicase